MRSIVLSLVVLAFFGVNRLRAAEPPKALDKGKVLILKNEHTMEGDIERVGTRYRVRRLIGETWVPGDQVLCLAASLPDAYAFLRGRTNREDADERLRLANWCRLNGLHEQALAEIRAAVQLRPDHADSRRLLQLLEQSQATTPPTKPTPHAMKEPPTEPAQPVELTTEALGMFATRVQPILMNTCARCHATGQGGKFRLTQAFEGGLANRRTLERNLASVLAEIDLNQPESSRLLTKAVSDHAHTGQAPLKDRKHAPYRTLESWVRLTVANNPHLRDSRPPAPVTPVSAPGLPASNLPRADANVSRTAWGADARPPVAPPSAPSPARPPGPVPVSNSVGAPPPPPPPVGPADPYDPEPFNRQARPETSKADPGK
jgi:hypothetical protein